LLTGEVTIDIEYFLLTRGNVVLALVGLEEDLGLWQI